MNVYHVLIDGLFDSVPILLTFMALYFGASDGTVGAFVSAGTAFTTLAGLGTLALSRSFSFMSSTGLVACAYGLGFIMASFAQSIWAAGLAFVVAVAGHTVFHNICFSYITQNTQRQALGRAMSDFTAIADVGRIPLVALAGFAGASPFLGFPGWRVVCFAYGFVILCAALWLLLVSRGEPSEHPKEGSTKNILPDFSLLQNKDVFWAMLGSVLNALSNDRIFTFLPLLLLAKGIDAGFIGSFAAGFTVGAFFGKIACGRCVDIFGARKVFIIAQLLLAVLLGILIVTTHIWVIVIVALLLGIVTKGTVPVIQAILAFPVRGASAYDSVFSINSLLRGITNMLTPLLFGVLASHWDMTLSYVIMAGASLVTIVPVCLMQKHSL